MFFIALSMLNGVNWPRRTQHGQRSRSKGRASIACVGTGWALSLRALWHFEEQPIVPRQFTVMSRLSDAFELLLIWRELTALPSGDGWLRHSGNIGKRRLIKFENLGSDVLDGFHHNA